MNQLRRNIMLGTAGHVDHGKSALVKLLTGCETDTLAEEKQRGLTIDLGFAPCQMADKRIVGIVDVPGHVDFIRNMVAGAHGIDVVMFVVAADDGIMPQTHEHLHILTLMGLRHGIVALTKIDLVDAARREFVVRDLRRLLSDTFLASAPICPMSNITGEGFDHFYDSLNTTVDACGDRSSNGLFRLWVEDAFTIRGAGTVVTGIPTHGRIQVGGQLHLLPAGLSGHVRRMQVYGNDSTEASAGECVALNIPELDHQAIKRGMTLVESEALPPVTMAEAELRILKNIQGRVEDYLEVQLHVGTASVAANLAMLECDDMRSGQRQFVQLRLATPLPLTPGERFVVRANIPDSGVSGMTTIGGGQILGLSNTRLRRKKQWTLDMLASRRAVVGDPLQWCEQMVRESDAPVSVADLQKQCWNRSNEIVAALDRLQKEGRIIRTTSGGWTDRDSVQSNSDKILGAVKAFHATHPKNAGISREELLSSLVLNPECLDAATDLLLQAKSLERNGSLLALAGWSARLPDRDQQLCDGLASRLLQAGWQPPALEELATMVGETPQNVTAHMRLLAERGMIVKLDDRIWMHRDAVEAAKHIALKLFKKGTSFSTMDFRDALGVSRKFAVPLVDHLDKIRFTVRSGNNRTPGVEARKMLVPNI